MAKPTRLFDTFAANLALYLPDYTDCFACPLCLHLFPRVDIHKLTVAHILSRKLGGKKATLACADCNSWVGANIEIHEIKRASMIRALSGIGKDTITIQMRRSSPDEPRYGVTAEMRMQRTESEPIASIRVLTEASNPEHLAEMKRYVRGGEPNWKLDLQWRGGYIERRAMLTYLHAAYMLLFHEFGYEWIIDPAAEPVRNQILSPDEDICIPVIPECRTIPGDDSKLSLHLVKSPCIARGFLIGLPSLDHMKSRVGVWIPFFGGEQKSGDMLIGTQMGLTHIPSLHSRLSDPAQKMMGHALAQLFEQ